MNHPAPKHVLKAAERYRRRLRKGDFIIRNSAGKMFWQNSGRAVGKRTVEYMIAAGQLYQRDADIFGDFDRGQTIGAPLNDPA